MPDSKDRLHSPIDPKLIAAARTQDPQALMDLHDQFTPSVHRMLGKLSGNPTLADDLTANAMSKILMGLEGYHPRPGVPFIAWGLRIARNTFLDHIRREKVGVQASTAPLDECMPLPDPTSTDFISHLESEEEIYRLLDHIPVARQRRVVESRFVLGFSIKEVAQELGISEDAVDKIQSRGLTALRRKLIHGEEVEPKPEENPFFEIQYVPDSVIKERNDSIVLMRSVASGMTLDKIAERESLSQESLTLRTRRVLNLINVQSRLQAVIWFMRQGYFSPADVTEDVNTKSFNHLGQRFRKLANKIGNWPVDKAYSGAELATEMGWTLRTAQTMVVNLNSQVGVNGVEQLAASYWAFDPPSEDPSQIGDSLAEDPLIKLMNKDKRNVLEEKVGLVDPELYRDQLSSYEQALLDPEYQEWLKSVGYVHSDSPEALDNFRLIIKNNPYLFTPSEYKALKGLEPLGSLMTYSMLAGRLWGEPSSRRRIEDAAQLIYRVIEKVQTHIPELPQMTLGTFRKEIIGIGVNTPLRPMELLTAYHIPWRDYSKGITIRDLSQVLYPDENLVKGKRLIGEKIAGLEKRSAGIRISRGPLLYWKDSETESQPEPISAVVPEVDAVRS